MDKYEEGLISVIVPVHNVAPYLERCIESICNQTYDKLQIIIVEDGSTDGSDVICDTFTDSRIIVIHSITSGLPAARNVGLEMATGEFITYVDSDDYLMPQMYEKLVKLIVDEDTLFVACGIDFFDGIKHTNSNEISSKERVLDYSSSVDALCDDYMFMVWNKLYVHKKIEEIRFVEGVSYEDVGYMRRVFEKLDKTVYLEEPLYVYRVMSTGSTSFIRDRYFHDMKLPVIDEYEIFIHTLEGKGLKKQARKMRAQQLGRIKQIYNQTGEKDEQPRKMLHKLFLKKLGKNNGWMVYPKSFLIFALIPEISRKKYLVDLLRRETENGKI